MTSNRRRRFAAAAGTSLLVFLSSCNGPSDESAEASGVPVFNEDVARETAVEDLSAQAFQDVGDTSACTEDCSGHNAGFEWAKDNEITDESECSGNNSSFIEGCEAYAQSIEESVEQERADAEAHEEVSAEE